MMIKQIFNKCKNQNTDEKIIECNNCGIHIRPFGKYFEMNDGSIECECCFMMNACKVFEAKELIK